MIDRYVITKSHLNGWKPRGKWLQFNNQQHADNYARKLIREGIQVELQTNK